MGGTVMLVIFSAVFVGIAIWAYLPRNKSTMESHGKIPFAEDQRDR